MLRLALAAAALGAGAAFSQTVCPPTPAYSLCDIGFDLPAATPAKPELNGEFRGPSGRTFLLSAFERAPGKLTIRFSPFEPGEWTLRLSSTLPQFHDKELHFTATPSQSLGWIIPANVHHFRYTAGGTNANDTPAHLWVGDTAPDLHGTAFEEWIGARARAGMTHIQIAVPSTTEPAAFDDLDSRLDAVAAHGMVADLVLSPPPGAGRDAREKYFEYLVARYAARNITWVMLPRFEDVPHAHELLREIAGYLDADPFHRIRSVGAGVTSAPFADEKWLAARSYGPVDWAIPAIEHQLYGKPAVATISASTPDEFRRLLWNATMSGAYPQGFATDPASLKYLAVWQKFFAQTRHWDLEPAFDIDNARGLSLPDTEYVIYVEHPQPVTVELNKKHKWDVAWVNPLTGEWFPEKNFRQDAYAGPPPDNAHDWVLYIYREGHKEGLRSYLFESRPVLEQEVEVDPPKVTFEIAKPSVESIALKETVPYQAKLKKETRAARQMVYEWTGEVTADDQGYRVLGTGPEGTFRVPPNIAERFPATLHVRVYGLNGLGKLYSLDVNLGITK